MCLFRLSLSLLPVLAFPIPYHYTSLLRTLSFKANDCPDRRMGCGASSTSAVALHEERAVPLSSSGDANVKETSEGRFTLKYVTCLATSVLALSCSLNYVHTMCLSNLTSCSLTLSSPLIVNIVRHILLKGIIQPIQRFSNMI